MILVLTIWWSPLRVTPAELIARVFPEQHCRSGESCAPRFSLETVQLTQTCVFVDGENFRRSIGDLYSDEFDRNEYLPKEANWAELFDWLTTGNRRQRGPPIAHLLVRDRNRGLFSVQATGGQEGPGHPRKSS